MIRKKRFSMDRFLKASAVSNNQHPKGMCYVSDRYKIIFIPIPKNASTSFRGMENFSVFTSNIMAYKKELESGEYKAFAIFRDPLDRFISGYIEVCKRGAVDSRHNLDKKFYWKNNLSKFKTFIEEIEVDCFDAHMLPQKWFLTDFQGNPFIVDAYIDINYVSTMLPNLLAEYGVEGFKKIDHLNKSSGIYRRFNIFEKIARNFYFSNLSLSAFRLLNYLAVCVVRRALPTRSEILQYIDSYPEIRERIFTYINSDLIFIENIRSNMYKDVNGILRR